MNTLPSNRSARVAAPAPELCPVAWGRGGIRHLSPFPLFPPAATTPRSAFSLIELLVVIAIIGIVAAISIPALNNMRKADAVGAATRQLLDDLNRARQLAISQRTTVYMVFVPANYWPASPVPSLNSPWATMLEKQWVGYNFVTWREIGSQPGQARPRYLGEWRALPDGIFIAPAKFQMGPAQYMRVGNPAPFIDIYGFETNSFPFPTPDFGTLISMPCIAFNSFGQLIDAQTEKVRSQEEIIPIVRGSVSPARDPVTKQATFGPLSWTESPPGNSTNAFNFIRVDPLTGRARIERQQIQ